MRHFSALTPPHSRGWDDELRKTDFSCLSSALAGSGQPLKAGACYDSGTARRYAVCVEVRLCLRKAGDALVGATSQSLIPGIFHACVSRCDLAPIDMSDYAPMSVDVVILGSSHSSGEQRGGEGRSGQVTPPVWSSTRSR